MALCTPPWTTDTFMNRSSASNGYDHFRSPMEISVRTITISCDFRVMIGFYSIFSKSEGSFCN